MNKKKAFTLIELIIVVVIIAITYGLYFVTTAKKDVSHNFQMKNIKSYMYDFSKKYGTVLTLLCSEDKEECFLLNKKKKVVFSFAFKQKEKVFLLERDEVLMPVNYEAVTLSNGAYFIPSLIYRKKTKTLCDPLIYFDDDGKWNFVNPYFQTTKQFANQEELISYIKKRAYLPMYAGVAK